MVTCPRDDHHNTEAASPAFVNPDDTKARIARHRVTQTTRGRRDNRPQNDDMLAPPCGSMRHSDFDRHRLTRGGEGERRREIDTSGASRTAIMVAKGGMAPAQVGASEGKKQVHATTRKASPYHRNPAGRLVFLTTTSDSSSVVDAACVAPSPSPVTGDATATATTTTVETSPESTRGNVRRGVVHEPCPCVQRKEPEAAAVVVESLEEEESLGKCYRGTSQSESCSAISGSGGCGSKAAGGAAAGEESVVVYVVPEQTPPAVRIVLERRPGWRAWDAAVHSPDEVKANLVFPQINPRHA